MFEQTIDRARLTWSNFNERERRLLSVMLGTLALLAFVLVVVLIQRGNTEIEEESEALREALSLINAQRDRFENIAAQRKAGQARYAKVTPPLGSLLEAKAKEQSIAVREVNDEPEKVSGNFKRRGARATLPAVALTPVMKLLAEIARSEFPVAVEYLQIEHFTSGQDSYNVQIGLVAYDKQAPKSTSDSNAKSSSSNAASNEDAP